ncbi:MAG: M28 family peptidase [Candidatus Eremiobacteraeota bacterium]|nr:M28 family peptidase [Candidatus Eremiobacteraeota bacterium]
MSTACSSTDPVRERVVAALWDSDTLNDAFSALVDCGGRFAGTASELRAREVLVERMARLSNATVRRIAYPVQGWTRGPCSLRVAGIAGELAATSLVCSATTPPGGLDMEIVDLGRGTADDFRRRTGSIAGKAVLVRHEFPFSVDTVHRRRKYGWAKECGARAFLIANDLPGIGVVSGSSGRGAADDLPSLGISYEAGARIAEACARGSARAIIEIAATRSEATGEHLVAEIPGRGDEWVVLCAHLDGHDLAESALDNASGAAVVLEVARALAPFAGELERGLRVMFFTYEEWALYGSQVYVESLSADERAKIALAINLDTVVGSTRLNALVSGNDGVASFVRAATSGRGAPVESVFPLAANSDHYNFFLAGIPALRLIAGYDDRSAATRYLLTPADTRDKVDPGQLRIAALTTAGLALAALGATGPLAARPNAEAVRSLLDAADPWVADRLGAVR